MIPKSSATRIFREGRAISASTLYGMMVFDQVYRLFVGRSPVATAIMDGEHMAGSKHYEGNAFDVRAHDLAKEMAEAILVECKKYLDQDFDIILENPGTDNYHFHCEFDPK